jgi:hypothetical protein
MKVLQGLLEDPAGKFVVRISAPLSMESWLKNAITN